MARWYGTLEKIQGKSPLPLAVCFGQRRLLDNFMPG
jgi:hypothetical protein